MAAREDQPQALIGDRAVLRLLVGGGVDARQLRQSRCAVGQRAVAPQAVDRAPAGRGHEPGGGARGDAVARPRRHGRRKRILKRVLRQLEIAQLADQRGKHSGALLPERALDRGGRRAHPRPPLGRACRHEAASASLLAAPTAPSSITGRTSVDP